jgi:hypothetical protein
MTDRTRRGSPVNPRTSAIFLGASIGLGWGGPAACSRSGPEPGASQSGSGSERPAAPTPEGAPAAPTPAAPTPEGAPAPGAPIPAGDAGAPDAPASADDFRGLSDEELRTLVTPRLRAGEKVAHKAFRGPLGPKPDGILVVVERDGNVAGFVLVPGGKPGDQEQRLELPPLSQGLLDGVPAVLFVDADAKPGKEAIIMTRQMTGAGPQGAVPRAFNQVIAWNGSAFERLSDVEEALLDLETAAAIRKALAAAQTKKR